MNKKSIVETYILKFLSKKGKASGYDLIKSSKDKNIIISTGSIYPKLKDLKDRKIIDFEINGRKKEYFLTSKGKKYIDKLNNSDQVNDYFNKIKLISECNCANVSVEFREAINELIKLFSFADWNGQDDLKKIKNKLNFLKDKIENKLLEEVKE
ncbi:PadR family transcriptional regulator [Geotoga petraea]|jgi:DNA-binding PadR family transcriptional regulator|uniref:PadR family transcriptional regulator n=1 Tax=Geotoga petraea TaxID=28234 RepID=A0A1G6LL58_9BACT|nr:PadR family transcriptional regulator [Geotoga petraea]TGG87625.1 PadR family transcriptional regulator [Geotoga petraea]SDC43406.1 Transcriptional regulator PadR-like family protein [Geotoga petraea]